MQLHLFWVIGTSGVRLPTLSVELLRGGTNAKAEHRNRNEVGACCWLFPRCESWFVCTCIGHDGDRSGWQDRRHWRRVRPDGADVEEYRERPEKSRCRDERCCADSHVCHEH